MSIRKKVSGLYCGIKCRKPEDIDRIEWWSWCQPLSHRRLGKIQQDYLSKLSTFRVLRREWDKEGVIWVNNIEMLLKLWSCRIIDQCQPVAGRGITQIETLGELIPRGKQMGWTWVSPSCEKISPQSIVRLFKVCWGLTSVLSNLNWHPSRRPWPCIILESSTLIQTHASR